MFFKQRDNNYREIRTFAVANSRRADFAICRSGRRWEHYILKCVVDALFLAVRNFHKGCGRLRTAKQAEARYPAFLL